MGSEVRSVPQAAALTGEVAGSETSIGRYLKCQRELRQISLDELAARTKIPRRSLERLEAGAFDRDTDGFARGFVRTVAEALGLDPVETVMRLLREPPVEEGERPGRRAARRGVLAVALALVALASAGLAAWAFGSRLLPRPAPEPERGSAPHVYRADAIRSLVEERARAEPPAASAAAAEEPAPEAGAPE